MKIKQRYKLLFIILLFCVGNVFVYFYDYKTEPFLRENYTLGQATLNVLEQVDETIIITFYQSDNLNDLEQQFSEHIQTVLTTFQQFSKVPFHIEKINPMESVEVELEATNSGIQAMEMKGEDNTLRKIFLGMIIQKGEQTKILPRLTPKMGIEYLLASTLRKLCEKKRRKIAFVQGHGEVSLIQLSDVGKRLLPNYDIEPIILSAEEDLTAYESMIIVSPSLKYNDEELAQLDVFLDLGKNIFIALDRVDYDDREKEGYKIDTRIEEWLVQKGLIVDSNFIVDKSCSDVRLSEYAPAIAFPYFPQITDFSSHITTQGIGAIVLRYASTIEFIGKEGVDFIPLAKTSEVSGKKFLPLRINVNHEWTKEDYQAPYQIVAGIMEGKLGEKQEKNAKIAIISDADLVLGNSEILPFENHLFVANLIDWLSDTSGLVTLKHKGVMKESKENEQEISTFEKYINLFLPILLIGCVGVFFYFRRKWHIEKLRSA
ncbi:MAG: Gldg family protein, partial [Flavobacteriaceae bacterium]|nr:Gldg family protein [Flavobacteriaceae bacterium]